MAFDGEVKTIPIKGIARAGADTIVEDGVMNEVIGLEYKDGSFVPYSGTKEGEMNVQSEIKKLFIHKTSMQTNVIGMTESKLVWLSKEDFDSGKKVSISAWNVLYEGAVNDVQCVKNIIIVNRNNTSTWYGRFSLNKYEEIKVDTLREGLPTANIYVTNSTNVEIRDTSNGPLLVVAGLNYDVFTNDTLRDVYRKGISKLNELGRLHGYVLALYAYKLVSGEYVYASAPILLCPPNDGFGKQYRYYDNYSDKKDSYYFTSQHYATRDNGALSVYEEFDSEFKGEGKYDLVADGFSTSGYKSVAFNTIPSTGVWYKDDTLPDIYVTENMPPLWGNLAPVYIGSSAARVPLLSMASNALKCKINGSIDASFEGLVESCCVFISDQIPLYDMKDDNIHSTNEYYPMNSKGSILSALPVCGYYFDKREEKDILDDIKNIRNFHLVHEIPFSDIKQGDVEIDLKDKLGDNLVLRETLPISAFSSRYVFSGSSFVYNSRHHLYDYREKLYYGFNLSTVTIGVSNKDNDGYSDGQIYDPYPSKGNYKVIAEIDSMVDGRSVVVSDTMAVDGSLLNRYITYPDASAKKLTIYLEDNGKALTFDLQPARSGGYAYAIAEGDFVNVLGTGESYSIPAESNVVLGQDNRIKVSDSYFAYTFPLANTYTIGNGTIIGLATLSTALSQDTFGQYPLLVFCTDGIYSMGVDTTGAGVYNNIAPFSREVCVNPNSICEIDGAVLFASNKGLMIATSQGVQEYLPSINGKPKHTPDGKELGGLGLQLYGELLDHENIITLSNIVDTIDFRDYIANADTTISYVSEKNKIIIYNANKDYVFWIDIPTRNVTKLPIKIKLDNNDYPTELYVNENGSLIKFSQLSANVNTQTMFQTRPIKLDGGMKSTLRVILRGYFNSLEQDKWAVLLVLGSYDAIKWQPIGIKQKELYGGFNDIGCNADRVSHKYMMVIFAGSLSRDSHIDWIEVNKKNKYNNKLR